MSKLIKAKMAARDSTITNLKNEIPMINDLIATACKSGQSFISINISSYSKATERKLEKAGYKIEPNRISWHHEVVRLIRDDDEFEKILPVDANVEILNIKQVAQVTNVSQA